MSKRALLVVVVILAAVAVVLLATGKVRFGNEPQPAPQAAEKTGATGGAATPPSPGPPAAGPQATIPQAKIKVDGKGDDWSAVPVFLAPTAGKWDSRTYRCQAVKLARDDENLYVLFALGLGIRQRYDKQLEASGRPSSGALGYLKFQTEGRQFSIWIPTGFSQKFDQSRKLIASMPTADFQVSRHNPSTAGWGEVFAAGSETQAEFIGFDGKLLELKLPLEKLGITGASAVTLSLKEM
jgi:hypothetical protein